MTRLTVLALALAAAAPAAAQDRADPPAGKPKDPAAELAKAFRAKLEEEIKKFEDRKKLFTEAEAASRAELDAALEGKGVAEREVAKARAALREAQTVLKDAQAELAKLKAAAEKK